VLPPSLDNAILTDSRLPRLEFQVTVADCPAVQTTDEVFGDSTVSVGFTMLRFASLTSLAPPLARTRMRACEVTGPVTVQLYMPT